MNVKWIERRRELEKNVYSWANNTIKCSLLSFGLFFLNYSRSHISLEVGIQFIASMFEIKNEFYKLLGMYNAYAVIILFIKEIQI